MLLSEVHCDGGETRLTDCDYSESREGICTHFEDAGVICVGMLYRCIIGYIHVNNTA